MFEKEAEEYGLENYRSYDDYPYVLTDEKAITKAFKDGAEYGYNKAKEEDKALIEKMKCCGNCAKRGHICVAEEMQGKLCGKNKDKWKLRR